MSLARVHDPLSLALVRRLGDAGGPRADHVAAELDSLIAWAKDAPRCIHRDTTTVGNVGAGLDSLHSFSLDTPNRLSTNGDYLDLWYGGNFAANDRNKRIIGNFGGQAYVPNGVVDLDRAVGWTLQVRIIRLSSTSVRASYILGLNEISADSANVVNTFGSGGYFQSFSVDLTGLSDLGANAQTLLVQGESVSSPPGTEANNDVTQNLSIIELCQQ